MGVLSLYPSKEHATVTYNRDGSKTYSAPYVAIVETAYDDGDTIVAYLDAIGYGIGTEYRYGTAWDIDAVCQRITPRRKAGSLTHWEVDLEYAPDDEKDARPDDDGNLTEDPLDWAYEIDISTSPFETPVWKAWNVDVFPKSGTAGYIRAPNTLGPVVNSAGVILDTPLMRVQNETVLRVKGNLPEFDQGWLDDFINKLNLSALIWHDKLRSKYLFKDVIILPHAVLCTGVSAAFRLTNDFKYWEWSYELRIREMASDTNPQNMWYESVLDRGITRSAEAGDPDGEGSTYSAGDMKDGRARSAPILGTDERRIPELVLLDGAGQPLTDTATRKTGIYFDWRLHGEVEMQNLPLRIFQ